MKLLSLKPHLIHRNTVYDDVINMYRNADVLQEHPFNVEFQGEKAIDFGGVARDVFNFF